MYPEDLPMVKLSNTRGLTNREVDVLSALLVETAQGNLGMASVFAIMQTAQEWMENKAGLQLGVHSISLSYHEHYTILCSTCTKLARSSWIAYTTAGNACCQHNQVKSPTCSAVVAVQRRIQQ